MTIDESHALLHRAGWSIGDAGFTGPSGRLVWVVSGTNGEARVVAEGATRAEAWERAWRQAQSIGL